MYIDTFIGRIQNPKLEDRLQITRGNKREEGIWSHQSIIQHYMYKVVLFSLIDFGKPEIQKKPPSVVRCVFKKYKNEANKALLRHFASSDTKY